MSDKDRGVENNSLKVERNCIISKLRIIYGFTGIAILVAIGWELRHELETETPRAASVAPSKGQNASKLLDMSSLIESCLQASRPILLGKRDPTGPSCVPVVRSGDLQDSLPGNLSDANGGPGTQYVAIYCDGRQNCKSAVQDLAWHQEVLVRYLRSEAEINQPAKALSERLAKETRDLYEEAARWTSLPGDLTTTGFDHREDWFSFCMTELDHAIAGKDLAAFKHWSGELATAAFSLADLHRWLDFLYENNLTALDFQARCQTLGYGVDARVPNYRADSTINQMPGGLAFHSAIDNFREIERQAERLFSVPSDRLDALAANGEPPGSSLWVLPRIRKCFVKLRNSLRSDNQKVWDEAAQTPFEHSYLMNILYRTWRTDEAVEVCEALRKFDATHPHASVPELMGVVMYRGHSFGGLEWDDRYEQQLLDVGNSFPASLTDVEAFQKAGRWTNDFFNKSDYGLTFTLKKSLEQGKLDCVRATDMIGSIYRNAGRPRFGNVRWSAETTGHSVAAYLGFEQEKTKTLLTDGLMPSAPLEVWPDCYFHGHAWPPRIENNPTPYSAELYIRGIDSYIWAEGYIIRGPNAGQLTTAKIPYLPLRQETGTRKVFAGPYPE